MRIVFEPLFRVKLRHSFYTSGSSTGDFAVEPAPATRRALQDHGLVFRRLADGWAVYGEVEPGSTPATLLRPLGGGELKLVFLLRPVSPYLWNISDLPPYRPGKSVFCFNNLRDDQENGRLHLSDSVADARVGEAVSLFTGESSTYVPAAGAAVLTLTDLAGAAVATFALADAASEHRVDLAGIHGLRPGRYRLSDDQGGSQDFYYDPEIFAGRPFGVVEVFTGDPVPAAYRFLAGGELTGTGEYTLQLESRRTTWRYNVVKKYDANGFALADLAITGPVTFAKTVEPDRAIFTSTAAVALGESRRGLVLEDQSNEIRDLPDPAVATPLAAGAAPGSFVSEMYVYV